LPMNSSSIRRWGRNPLNGVRICLFKLEHIHWLCEVYNKIPHGTETVSAMRITRMKGLLVLQIVRIVVKLASSNVWVSVWVRVEIIAIQLGWNFNPPITPIPTKLGAANNVGGYLASPMSLLSEFNIQIERETHVLSLIVGNYWGGDSICSLAIHLNEAFRADNSSLPVREKYNGWCYSATEWEINMT
jgi:hypothetical protein